MQFFIEEEDSSDDDIQQQSQTVSVMRKSNKPKRVIYTDSQQIDSFLVLVEKATREDRFKQYIKSVVYDELFYRKLFDDNRLSDKIDYKLNSFKSDIKLIVQSIVPDLVQSNVKLYLSSNLAKEINTQMPNYLNNNHQMQQLLNNHQVKLEQALTSKLTELVTTIVNEEQYHTVNKAYFDAFRNKGDNEINTFATRGTNAVSVVRMNGETAIRELQTRYENNFTQLTNNLAESQNLRRELNELKMKFNEYISYTDKAMFGLGCVTAVALALGLNKFIR